MNGLRIGQGKVRGESCLYQKEREVKTGRDMRVGGRKGKRRSVCSGF